MSGLSENGLYWGIDKNFPQQKFQSLGTAKAGQLPRSLALFADHLQAGYSDVASFGCFLLYMLCGFSFLLLG